MAENTSQTYREIVTQPDAWEESVQVFHSARSNLDAVLARDFGRVFYTGCGSTFYISEAGAALTQDLSAVNVWALPASEFFLYPNRLTPGAQDDTLLIATSRSGKTSETVQAMKAFRKANENGSIIAITNEPDSPVAELSDISLVIPSGQEIGIAQTRSFSSMYIAHTALSALLAGRDDLLDALPALPAIGRQLIADFEATVEEFASNAAFNQFFFLGSGPRYALASEVSLKLKEISLSNSEPFHFMEFRHGPAAMVDTQTLIIGLLSESSRSYEEPVLREMRDLGAETLTVAENDADVTFHSELPEPVRGVLYLPALQLFALYRALAKNLDPDNLKNLVQYIELDLSKDAV